MNNDKPWWYEDFNETLLDVDEKWYKGNELVDIIAFILKVERLTLEKAQDRVRELKLEKCTEDQHDEYEKFCDSCQTKHAWNKALDDAISAIRPK